MVVLEVAEVTEGAATFLSASKSSKASLNSCFWSSVNSTRARLLPRFGERLNPPRSDLFMLEKSGAEGVECHVVAVLADTMANNRC